MKKIAWTSLVAWCVVAIGCGASGNSGSDPSAGGFKQDAFDPSSLGDLAACATSSAGGALSPVNLVFMVDVTDSMFTDNHRDTRWYPMVAAAKVFFTDPASGGLKASLDYFPQGFNGAEKCDSKMYTTPEIALTPLPSDVFGAFFDRYKRGFIGTPTRAALTGAIAEARDVQKSNAGTRTAVVFVTDGLPSECGTSDADEFDKTVEVAKQAAGEIPTFVIGMATGLTDLNRIAEAGGTHKAVLIDADVSPDTTRDAFRAALGRVSSQAGTCAFPLPNPPDGKTLDTEKVNVVFTPSGGSPDTLGFRDDCQGDGWRYDDRTHPSRVELCPSSCQRVRADKGGKMTVAFGCATHVALK